MVVGAQRTATTWLFECLRSHPQVYVPSTKEIGYFNDLGDSNYDKGLSWYLGHFREACDYDAIGELTPEYLLDPKAPGRIYTTLGSIKIIVVVRDPVDRAYSSYGKGVRENDWSCSFGEFIANELDYCIERGRYYTQLSRYLDTFSNENILVKIYEDMTRNPEQYIHEIYEFLGVDSNYIPLSLKKKFNIGTPTGGQKIKLLVRARDIIYQIPVLNRSIKFIQRTEVGNQLVENLLKSYKAEIPQEVVMQLQALYYDEISSLSHFLNRDLVAEWFN
jgi:hypothetical protein